MSREAQEKHWPSLIVFLALSAAAVGIGQLFPPDAWFESLVKPAFNPPKWAFPLVWTPLYLMIAVAGWLIWTTAPKSRAMAFWAIQFVLNAAWTWLFFGLHRPDFALAEIALLWLTIGGTILTATRVNLIAAWLLVPYWLWVAFATALNFEFWRLNG